MEREIYSYNYHSFRIPQFNYVDRIVKLRFRRLYRVKIEDLANNMSQGRDCGFMNIRLRKKHGPISPGKSPGSSCLHIGSTDFQGSMD